jgi:hypothetical protein
MVAWGDSFTHGVGEKPYPTVLSELTGFTVYNEGIPGETSVQIKNRMIANVEKQKWPTLILAGRNDFWYPDSVKHSIAMMVSRIKHNNYLILSIWNGAGEGRGTYGYGLLTELNAYLSRTYGSHFLDVRPYLAAHYNPNSPQDVADHNADITPTSLRADWQHLNSAGNTLVGNYVYQNLNKLIDVTPCQGTSAAPFSTFIKGVTAGATLRFYSTATDTSPIGSGSLFAPNTSALGQKEYYISQVFGDCESPRSRVVINTTNCTNAVASQAFNLSSNASEKAISSELALVSSFAAYPNPTAGQTTISFVMNQPQPFRLQLYSPTGQLLQEIAAGESEAGLRYTFSLDMKKHTHAAGLYHVYLRGSRQSQHLRVSMLD